MLIPRFQPPLSFGTETGTGEGRQLAHDTIEGYRRREQEIGLGPKGATPALSADELDAQLNEIDGRELDDAVRRGRSLLGRS